MSASGMSGQAWASRFPVYQIDFQAVASGKHIAATKRKVRWRFGFPNKQALDAGRTGVDCRGEEHDVVIIWSITSGKRQVYMDGNEVHYSTSRSSTFQYSWSARGNHVIKVVAHAAPPVSPIPGFRQYDLHIDGQSFFTMPKAYELGLRGPVSAYDRVPGTSYGSPAASPSHGYGSYNGSGFQAPNTREEEDRALQEAINASLEESQKYLASRGNIPESSTAAAPATQAVDLMDFGGPRTAPDSQSITTYNAHQYGAPQPGQYGAPPAQYGSPSPQYSSPPPQYSSPPPQYGAPQSQYSPQSQAISYQQPSPGYGAPSQQNYQTAQPSSSTALVPINAPSQPYAVPQGNQSFQSPAPAAPSYGASAAYAPSAPPTYGSPHPQQQQGQTNFFSQPPPDQFVPAPQGQYSSGLNQWDDPFAPKPSPPPTRDDITKSILAGYGAPSSSQQQQGQQMQQRQPGQDPALENGKAHVNGTSDGAKLSMSGYAAQPEEKPLSDMEKAMKRLVNIDRIDEPAEEEYRLTMKKKEDSKKVKDGKSKGLPPAASGVVGSNATLSDISRVKGNIQKTGEGVMRPPPPTAFHPDAVNAGALVVHGQGAPPLQRGFGIGYGAPPPNYQQYARW